MLPILLGTLIFKEKLLHAFFHLVGNSEMLAYADLVNTEIEEGRLGGKRSYSYTSNWDTTLSKYNAVCPASRRAQDVHDFPNHRGLVCWPDPHSKGEGLVTLL